MIVFFFLFIFFLSGPPENAFAQTIKRGTITNGQIEEIPVDEKVETLVNPEDADKVDDNEEELVDRSVETGILQEHHHSREDHHRHSLQFQLNPVHTFYAFDYIYALNLNIFWLEGLFSYAVTKFGTISDNPSGYSSNPFAEVNNPRPQTAEEKLTTIGAGISYRFKYPDNLNILKIQRMFQSTAVYLTYTSLDDSYRSLKYNGFGLRADYGLQKRLTIKSHFGLKFSYNFVIVKRAEEGQDIFANDRRLFLAWPSLALDYSLYF